MNTKQDYSWETTHSIGYMSHHFGKSDLILITSFLSRTIGLFKNGEKLANFNFAAYSNTTDYINLLRRIAKEAAQWHNLPIAHQ